jgi:hypothetical protein
MDCMNNCTNNYTNNCTNNCTKVSSNGDTIATRNLKMGRIVLTVQDILYTDSIRKWNEQYIPVGQFGYVYGIDSDTRKLLKGIKCDNNHKGNVTFYYDTINECLNVITLCDIAIDEPLYTDHNIEHLYHYCKHCDTTHLEST